MKDYEHLLSHYDFIVTLLDAGYLLKEIVQEVNSRLNTVVTYRQLQYLIYMVKSNTVHREYDNLIVIDGLQSSWDKLLTKFCVKFNGLLLTYKSAAHLINPAIIITPDNLLTVYSKESLLYAKRILKLYHLPDDMLLEEHKQAYPDRPDINLNEFTGKIRVAFNNEFNKMLSDLRSKYVDFVKNHLKELINAKEKNI